MEEGFHIKGWKGALAKGIQAREAQRRAGYGSESPSQLTAPQLRPKISAHGQSVPALDANVFYPPNPNRGDCARLPPNPNGTCTFTGVFDSVLYEAAVLEFDPTILPQRVYEAKSAITAHLQRMRQVGDSSEDKLLLDALVQLNEVLRMRLGFQKSA
jgi:hypothetical protein